MKAEKSNWVIAYCNSDGDDITMTHVYGTKYFVKRCMMKSINLCKYEDIENYDYGTETIKDIEDDNDYLSAVLVFGDYHITYTAQKIDNMRTIDSAKVA